VAGVLEGFVTIIAVIGLGALLAQIGVLDDGARIVLSRLAFFVASPALMITVLGDTDVGDVLSKNLVASAAGVLVTSGVYVVAARFIWHRDLADTVIGTLCAAYVNAGNLGLPVAAYALGDASLVAPTLLMQMLVLQPLALAVLDHATSDARFSLSQAMTAPLRNPLTVGSILGLVLAVTGVTLPPAVRDPLELVGGMAVPSMLVAYGISLRLGPRPGEGTSVTEIGVITFLKLALQPLTAYVVARYLLDLGDTGLLAVTVLSALPTAQNIFVHATRYGRAEVLARDSVFVTTVLSVPAIVAIVALVH
jgi:malonate transporter and related proteins